MLVRHRDFYWATAALWASAWVIRYGRTFYHSALGLPATVDVLDSDTVRLSVRAPPRFRWTPGQHVFVRVLAGAGVHALTSHPFTIANVPAADSSSAQNTVELVFRVHDGTTRVLAGLKRTSILLDGPYGGLPEPFYSFDRACLLAGGSGAGARAACTAWWQRWSGCWEPGGAGGWAGARAEG